MKKFARGAKVLIGIDIQPVSEVEESIREFGPRYTRRLFTDHEIESCGERAPTAAIGLAARFAAKEAVIKVLSVGETAPNWKSIEVRREESGRPHIVLSGEAADLAHRQGVSNLSLSISHAGGLATAAVVAQSSTRRRWMRQ